MENLQQDPQPFLDALERAIRDREPIRRALLADGGEDAPAALWSSAIQCLDTAAREGIGVRRYLKHGAGVRPPQSVQQILKRQVEISQDFGAGGMSEGNYRMEMDKILLDVSAETRNYLDRLWYGSPGDPEATVAWEVHKASKRRKDLTPAAKSTATLRSTVAAHSAKFADNVPIQPGMEEWVNTVDGLAATLEGLDPDNWDLLDEAAQLWGSEAGKEQRSTPVTGPTLKQFGAYVKRIDPGTASGKDQVRGDVVKAGGSLAAKLLHQCYYDLLALCKTPAALSEVVVTYILKHGNKRDPSSLADHRPISCFASPERSSFEQPGTTQRKQPRGSWVVRISRRRSSRGQKWRCS